MGKRWGKRSGFGVKAVGNERGYSGNGVVVWGIREVGVGEVGGVWAVLDGVRGRLGVEREKGWGRRFGLGQVVDVG